MNNYTLEEDNIILNNYNKIEIDDLIKLLHNRNKQSIYNRAFKLNIKKETCKNTCKNLLLKTPESYYWLGFLIADGHFSKNNVLHINIIKNDLNHLINFCNFLQFDHKKIKIKNNIIRLSISDNNTLSILKSEYNINSNKTYNPINFNFNIETDFIMCFLIGLIDGDGSITNKKKCYITAHKSWFNFYNNFKIGKNYIYDNNIRYFINTTYLYELKKIIYKYDLPVLNRKWNKLDKLYKNNKVNFIIDLLKSGLNINDIINQYNFSKSCIYKSYNLYQKEKDINYKNTKEQYKNKKEQFMIFYDIKSKKEICSFLEISTSSYNRWKRETIKKRDQERDMKRNSN